MSINVERTVHGTEGCIFLPDVYLDAFSDVAVSCDDRSGALRHFQSYGKAEGRLHSDLYAKTFQLHESDACDVPVYIDAVTYAGKRHLLVIGWALDQSDPFDAVDLLEPFGEFSLHTPLVRHSRPDVAAAHGLDNDYSFGFYALAEKTDVFSPSLGIRLRGPSQRRSRLYRAGMSLETLHGTRNRLLYHLGASHYPGNRDAHISEVLSQGIGASLGLINKRISAEAVPNSISYFFGAADIKPDISLIVCLFGKIEFLFLQAALFSTAQSAKDKVEFIYVLNSPEDFEKIMSEAKIAHLIYGFAYRTIIMPENVGFGAANNEGVRHARADRIIIVNPDVFPIRGDWLERHATLVATLPAEQTQMFGVPLLYDDGSVMHAGMSVHSDHKVMFAGMGGTRRPGFRELLRVEHPHKGMIYREQSELSKRVTAVTGAFIAMERKVFERLGGFDESFVFGHYEDADLCLRARDAGIQVWLHNLPFWHLEGKGSIKLPIQEVACSVNRWIFSNKWSSRVRENSSAATPIEETPFVVRRANETSRYEPVPP